MGNLLCMRSLDPYAPVLDKRYCCRLANRVCNRANIRSKLSCSRLPFSSLEDVYFSIEPTMFKECRHIPEYFCLGREDPKAQSRFPNASCSRFIGKGCSPLSTEPKARKWLFEHSRRRFGN